MVRRTSTCQERRRPRCSRPCDASRFLSCATVRWTCERSWAGFEGSARSSSRSGLAGGSACVRSIICRSSSRRTWRSNSWSRSRGTLSGSGSSAPGFSPFSPSVRRMRCTSTPITPEPSPWRPKAAIASRARSRISPSEPARIASRMRSRSASRSSCSPPWKRSSARPCSIASRSTARKKKRSNSTSSTCRSSCDFASVAASASRKSSCEVQLTASSASKASSSSEVPTATPSRAQLVGELEQPRRHPRRARPPRARRRRGRGYPACRPEEAIAQLHSHALRHQVEVGAVLDDDRHRALEHRLVDVLGAEQEQRPRPVDRLGDRGRLLQVERADHVDDLDELARHCLVQLRGVQVHDLELALDRRVVEPEVEAAPLERLGQLTRVVRGEQHERVRPRLHDAELGDRDLEVGEHLEQHRLELLVGLVDLVDQEHDRLLGGDGVEERTGEHELLAEDVVLDLLPARVGGLGLDPQQLLAVVPLVQRLGLVEPLVALEADQPAPGRARDAPWPARSCRRPPGPPRAPACPAGRPGTTRATRARPPGSRPRRAARERRRCW